VVERFAGALQPEPVLQGEAGHVHEGGAEDLVVELAARLSGESWHEALRAQVARARAIHF
jgi:hypothetical protein